MNEWTLAELIDDVKYRVAINSNQTNLEFIGPTGDPNQHFRRAINNAYTDEYSEACTIVDKKWFYDTVELTWAAGSTTLELPVELRSKWLIRIFDITSDPIGYPLYFSEWPSGRANVHWSDNKTMQWMNADGPSADMTLKLTYCGEPLELVDNNDKPVLIPEQFRHLLAWSAAIELRMLSDDGAPSSWERARDRIRMKMLKFLSMRGPIQTAPTGFLNPNQDNGSVSY